MVVAGIAGMPSTSSGQKVDAATAKAIATISAKVFTPEALLALDEHHRQIGAADGNDEAGQASARSEIGHRHGAEGEERHVPLGVHDGVVERRRTDRPPVLQTGEHRQERLRQERLRQERLRQRRHRRGR